MSVVHDQKVTSQIFVNRNNLESILRLWNSLDLEHDLETTWNTTLIPITVNILYMIWLVCVKNQYFTHIQNTYWKKRVLIIFDYAKDISITLYKDKILNGGTRGGLMYLSRYRDF